LALKACNERFPAQLTLAYTGPVKAAFLEATIGVRNPHQGLLCEIIEYREETNLFDYDL
jgi:hypothetical protein